MVTSGSKWSNATLRNMPPLKAFAIPINFTFFLNFILKFLKIYFYNCNGRNPHMNVIENKEAAMQSLLNSIIKSEWLSFFIYFWAYCDFHLKHPFFIVD